MAKRMVRAARILFRMASRMLSRRLGVKSNGVHRHRLISFVRTLSMGLGYERVRDERMSSLCPSSFIKHPLLKADAGDQPRSDLRQSNRRIEPIFTSPPSFFPVVALAADSFRPWGATTRSGSNQFHNPCPHSSPPTFRTRASHSWGCLVRTKPALFADALKKEIDGFRKALVLSSHTKKTRTSSPCFALTT